MGWNDLLTRAGEDVRLAEAVAVDDADSVSDLVRVVVPSFHREQTWGPAPWMPRVTDAGNLLKINRGDRCLIALAETEDPGEPEVWIIAWWP